MELLSVLPRGTGPLGFYEDATQRVPIEATRLAADVPEAERSKLQVLRTDTPLFDAVVESRRNRRAAWYKRRRLPAVVEAPAVAPRPVHPHPETARARDSGPSSGK